jgi:redox-sensing transcriptional repressor
MVVLGGGRICQALANYTGFDKEGFHVLAVFDVQTAHTSVRDGVQVLPISALADFLKENPVEIAVIATQKESAEEVAATAVELGIRSLWNFAPVDLSFGEDVAVENINMSESLYMLAYKNKNLL